MDPARYSWDLPEEPSAITRGVLGRLDAWRRFRSASRKRRIIIGSGAATLGCAAVAGIALIVAAGTGHNPVSALGGDHATPGQDGAGAGNDQTSGSGPAVGGNASGSGSELAPPPASGQEPSLVATPSPSGARGTGPVGSGGNPSSGNPMPTATPAADVPGIIPTVVSTWPTALPTIPLPLPTVAVPTVDVPLLNTPIPLPTLPPPLPTAPPLIPTLTSPLCPPVCL